MFSVIINILFTIVFAEVALERVPKELLNEPLVVSAAHRRGKKPAEMLLDWSVHSEVMKRLDDWKRRGRPDQVYKFLSLCQESLANKKGELRVFVHTRDNEVLCINPETRFPPSYRAFEGLIEDVYRKRVIDFDGKVLLELREQKLVDLLEELGGDFAVFDPKGKPFKKWKGFDGVVIGGFPNGDFKTSMEELTKFSLGEHDLTPLAATCEALGAIK